ncbi:MAG: formate dehydrogenase subunit alpha [bacterium]
MNVKIEIDGNNVNVKPGYTVLQAAKQSGIYIPSLCDYAGLLPYGSCRLCGVIVEGKKGYLPSCSLYVESGMKIKTFSDELFSLKKTLMELYLSDHPNDCLTCSKNGICELQTAASYFGLSGIRFRGKSHLNLPIDDSNPYFLFDPKRCVVCLRCVRACAEIQGNFALTVDGRGFNSVIKAGFSRESSFFNSECVSCGACVKACPTGALVEKNVAGSGKPFFKTRTTCGYCGVGCSFSIETKGDKIIRAVPVDESLSNYGHSCIKGRFSFGYVNSGERLKYPLIRENLSLPFKEVSWNEAFGFVADRFKKIQEKYGINAIGAISSSRCSNEENYLMQKLVRAGFHNNNIDTCARVCHQPTGYGLGIAFGAGAGTQDLSSVLESDVIIVIGSNPTEAHPVVGSFIRKTARLGAELIVIDPRKTEVSKSPHVSARFHLRPFPGTNVILLNAMAYYILKENLIKKDFIEKRCDEESFKLWKDFIINETNSPDVASKISGVPKKDIEGAAALYAKAGNASIFYGLGVTEHLQGSTGVLAIANLAMVTGNIGRKGVGVSPLRGQNNVQGAADMGAEPSSLPGYRHISDGKAREIFEKIWNVKLDGVPGMRLPDMLRGALDGRFKGIYIMGEDIVQTDPDSNRIIASLMNMDTVVVHDLFKTASAEYAHVLLPGSSFLEKNGTFTNWERRVQRVRKVMEPAAGLQDWQIISGLSNALGYGMTYGHPSEIMDEIARSTPQFSGISYDLLEKKGSAQWPVNTENPEGTAVLHRDKFTRGKGKFTITKFIGSKDAISKEYPFILTTVRNLYQYNCSNNTRRSHNSLWYGRDVLEICPEDAEKFDITDGGLILVRSKKGAVTLNAKITGRMMPGVVATTFHFPEFKTNILTSEYADWSTETPEYKVTAVSISKAGAPFASRDFKPLLKGNDEIKSMFLDICRIFSPYPIDVAAEEVQVHIDKYWEPVLRLKLFEIYGINENNFKSVVKEVIGNLIYLTKII